MGASAQWTEIATDATGDSGGLEAVALEYLYDEAEDEVRFRVTVTNLASYSTGPAADFSFNLPSGLDSGNPTGTHWSSPTPVHKTAYIYCDPGGSAPDSYTYSSWSQRIEETGSTDVLCSNCVDIFVDVPNNQITYTFDRTDIITDTEMGGETEVEIGLVMNVGHDVGWDDAVTHSSGGASSATFTISISDGGGASIFENQTVANMAVYPNPTNDILWFTPADDAEFFVVSDLLGNEIIHLPVVDGTNSVDVSGLSLGVYILSSYGQNKLIGKAKFSTRS